MATRKTQQAQPAQANLTVDQMRRAIPRLERLIKEIEDFDHTTLPKRWSPEQKALEATIEATLSSVFGHDTVEYRRYRHAASLDHGSVSMSFGGYQDTAREARQYVAEGKIEASQLLKTAVRWLEDEIANSEEASPTATPAERESTPSSKIFVVHGHDEGALNMVARFIENIGYEAIILSEQPNRGLTIIEKIEEHSDVGFAVVLLTPDDVGGKTADALAPRARQNVLLELGYFMGVLGRNNVCALRKGDVDIPTDFAGVAWHALDSAGAWKVALGKELQAANYAVNWNKVMA